jgi:hypothetical protein
MKSKVDGGRAVDVGEALMVVAAAGQGPKELEHILGVTSCFIVCSTMLFIKYLKCYKYILRAQIKVR